MDSVCVCVCVRVCVRDQACAFIQDLIRAAEGESLASPEPKNGLVPNRTEKQRLTRLTRLFGWGGGGGDASRDPLTFGPGCSPAWRIGEARRGLFLQLVDPTAVRRCGFQL